MRKFFIVIFLIVCVACCISSFVFESNIHKNNRHQQIKADLIELVIASDPTLSSEEIKHRVNDLYKFIVEDEK